MLTTSIIIVNYNGKHLLEDCLDGLQAQTRAPDEVIVVDNGSQDGSIAFLRCRYPWARLIESGENLGFSAGNNRGIRSSSGDVVVLLNNDTVPSPGFVEEIVRPLESDTHWSAVAGIMLFSSDPNRIATAGIEVFENGLALDRDVGRLWRERSGQVEVFGPSGGAVAFRRSALFDVELFPEPFFLYLEDVDLAWRLKLRRHRTVVNPAAWTLHVYSASATEGSPLKNFYLARNRAWALLRCWPASLWRRHWISVLWYEFCSICFALATLRFHSIRGRFAGWAGIFRLMRVRRLVQSRSTAQTGDLLYWLRPAPSVRNVFRLRRVIQVATRRRGTDNPGNFL
ncbi:MAG: glycosyltransferase family 2 protein [Thermomicrobiaceae bacterium]